jgi:hypothetical protein
MLEREVARSREAAGHRWLVVAALAACITALTTGCAGRDDRAQVRATTERFYAAVGHRDGAQACAELGEDTVKQIEQQEKSRCAEAVVKLKLAGARIRAVRVFLTSAKVDLAGGESAYLDETESGWKLSAVGCKPQGKPRDRPFDCEVEA